MELPALEGAFMEFGLAPGLSACVCLLPAYAPCGIVRHPQLFPGAPRLTQIIFKDIFLIGEFNTGIDWSDCPNPVAADSASSSLLDMVETLGLVQVCSAPTYHSPSGTPSFLDLYFIFNSAFFARCSVQESLCDHLAVCVQCYTALPSIGHEARIIHAYGRTNVSHAKSCPLRTLVLRA